MRLAIGLAILAALVPGVAQAQATMSMNHLLTDGMTFAECMERADSAMRSIGLDMYAPRSESQWGSTGGMMATIYCIDRRKLAVVAVAGPTPAQNSALLSRLMAAFRGQ